MSYRSDDIVQTKDGKQHRVLYKCKCGTKLFVKTLGKRRTDAHKIKISDVVVTP